MRRKVLIIYAHPYIGSFNHAIFTAIKNGLMNNNINYRSIDLYKDDFKPEYSSKELALYSQGKTADPLVKKYQRLIKWTNSVIFIFPVWWNSIPAIVKGFIDKIMKKNFAYRIGATGVIPLLHNIKETKVITTSTSPKWYLKWFCGNDVKRIFMNTTLKQLGFQNRLWIDFGSIGKSTLKKRKSFLNWIANLVK